MVAIAIAAKKTKVHTIRRDKWVCPKMLLMPGMEMPDMTGLGRDILERGPSAIIWIMHIVSWRLDIVIFPLLISLSSRSLLDISTRTGSDGLESIDDLYNQRGLNYFEMIVEWVLTQMLIMGRGPHCPYHLNVLITVMGVGHTFQKNHLNHH